MQGVLWKRGEYSLKRSYQSAGIALGLERARFVEERKSVALDFKTTS
jgi:hypothetical protein